MRQFVHTSCQIPQTCVPRSIWISFWLLVTVMRPPSNPKRRRKEKQKHFCEFANEWSEQQKPMFSWWHLVEIKRQRFWRKWNLISLETLAESRAMTVATEVFAQSEWRVMKCGCAIAVNCVKAWNLQQNYDLWIFVNTLISHCPLTTVNTRRDGNSIVIRRVQDFCSNSTR